MNNDVFEVAFRCAEEAAAADEVPVGAVVFETKTGKIVAGARNRVEELGVPTAHAEMMAIQEACQIVGQKFLTGYSLFVTLEPCVMCAGAIALARLDTLYFGAYDSKSGGIGQGACVFTHPQTHHKIKIEGGIEAEKCGALLTQFFKGKRHG